MDAFPSHYRMPANATGTLRVAVLPCSLGVVLVARSDAGVRAVLLGDDADALRADLAARFPGARLEQDDDARDPMVRAVVHAIDAPPLGRPEPVAIDPVGTPFQRAVWEALRDIPAGGTITYQALAARLGRPTSARAVAQACGANPLAVIVPCHRVVRSDGEISGYRWGVERKRELLRRERLAST